MYFLYVMYNVTADGESVEGRHAGNTELTADEINQLQQNMRYVYCSDS